MIIREKGILIVNKIIRTHVLIRKNDQTPAEIWSDIAPTKFYEDWTKMCRIGLEHYTIKKKTASLHPLAVFKANVLSKFHKVLTQNVTSRVFTRSHYNAIRKTASLSGSHVYL
ncbi:hypothetical protein DPMN_111677 [Dreissena polymorpha]|uniref:Uncharacterized protein n=1 Tax=Dreissena polymorpha TaxID=45954 RepID=A0A9D4KF05_DREPO|nr:hypothetical protein DPMN_111677 [Dreissena polymorpha]